MKEVFVLEHIYKVNDSEEIKFIGIYSSEQNAKNAIEELKSQPGFRDRPNNFCINKEQIDRTGWKEGYTVV